MTMMQFIYKDGKDRDYRVKIYNKWVNLLECESMSKKIGMGTKSLFYCSSTMFAKHR